MAGTGEQAREKLFTGSFSVTWTPELLACAQERILAGRHFLFERHVQRARLTSRPLFYFSSPVEVTLNFGFKVVDASPHQAHRNALARATADVFGSNRIVMPWA